MAVIKLDEATFQAEIAKTVSKDLFNSEFGTLKERISKQESQSFQVMLGVLIASFLVFIALAIQVWLFVASYNQHYLNAESTFSQRSDELKKENVDLQSSLKSEIERMRDKQDYLEKLMLGQAQLKK